MLTKSSRVSLLAITVLLCLVVKGGAAPIDSLSSEGADLTDRSHHRITQRGTLAAGSTDAMAQRHTASSAAAIVKHVKPLCNGSICRHADFLD